LYTLK